MSRVARTGSLRPADKLFGTSFTFLVGRRHIDVCDTDFGVVREIVGQVAYGGALELRNATCIVDAGANVGVFTLFALAVASAAHVVAIEAQRELCDALTANLRRNQLEERATVVHGFVGTPVSDWARDLLQSAARPKQVSIADVFPAGATIDFLKMDIEGAEYGAFNVEPRLLSRIRRIAIECHGNVDQNLALRKQFTNAGFEVLMARHGAFDYLVAQHSTVATQTAPP